MAVRDAAKQLQLTPVGSLGIVVRAYRQGFITPAEAENAITQLYDVSSLFVTRAIVEFSSAPNWLSRFPWTKLSRVIPPVASLLDFW